MYSIYFVIEFFTNRSSLLYDVILDARPFNYCTERQYKAKYNKDPDFDDPDGSFVKEKVRDDVPVWLEEEII